MLYRQKEVIFAQVFMILSKDSFIWQQLLLSMLTIAGEKMAGTMQSQEVNFARRIDSNGANRWKKSAAARTNLKYEGKVSSEYNQCWSYCSKQPSMLMIMVYTLNKVLVLVS